MQQPHDSALVTIALDAVGELVRYHYDLVPTSLSRSDGEAASVTKLTTAEGSWAAKIMAAAPGVVDLVAWQGELSERTRASGLPVARLKRSRGGEHAVVAVWGSLPFVMQVTEWLDAAPVAAGIPSSSLLRDIGYTAGRVSLALASAPPPPSDVSHIWDLRRTIESLDIALSRIPPGRSRATLLAARERFATEASPLLPDLRMQVVHHDLHDENLLTDGERITGVLDFGDAVRGVRVAELIVAAAYASRRSEHPANALRDVIAGWLAVTELDDAESRMILPAVIGRLATNAALWMARAGGERADYARSRIAGSLDTIDRLIDTNTDGFVGTVRERY
ncbi:MAG TPA: phosphotransferase [Marmoricola sp.]|nr:phosphotransferase [Marmoricola sp.]